MQNLDVSHYAQCLHSKFYILHSTYSDVVVFVRSAARLTSAPRR
jgi:hypothetical protein